MIPAYNACFILIMEAMLFIVLFKNLRDFTVFIVFKVLGFFAYTMIFVP
jgi:hypothetical protein